MYIYIMHPFTEGVRGFIVIFAWYHLFLFAFLSLVVVLVSFLCKLCVLICDKTYIGHVILKVRV